MPNQNNRNINTSDSFDDDATGSIEEIIAEVQVEETVKSVSDAFLPDVVRTLDDALKVVDNSDLPPAPVTPRRMFETYPANTHATNANQDFDTKIIRTAGANAKKQEKQSALTSETTIIPTASKTSAANKNKPDEIVDLTQDTKLIKSRSSTKTDAWKLKKDDKKDDFKIKFDFDSAYKDVPEDKPLRRRRERRTGLIGGFMYALFILSVGLVLGSAMWLATIDVLGFAADDEDVDVLVPDEFTMDSITDMLYDAGLIRYKRLFNIFADYSNAEEKIAPGQYVLNRNYDYRALVQGMTARAGVRVETTVTIPEGFTLAQIFNLLEREDVCPANELWNTATHHDFNFFFLEKETLGNRLRLEGFLFPDTYNFYKDSTPVQALTKMLREFNNKFTEQYIERADFLGYTVRDIVSIASMIEREAGSDDERARISAVIHNRLNNPETFPMLEIDATFIYAVAGTAIRPSPQVDSPYNTYLYPGLPPGPIANPGLASITAALYPMSTNEYFYALNREGTHNFFRTAADHLAFVNSDEFGG